MPDWLWQWREVRRRKRAGKCGFSTRLSDPRYPLDICVRPAPCAVHTKQRGRREKSDV